ncbi:MAG: ECF transporter S component, partial [Bacillota bacterium]
GGDNNLKIRKLVLISIFSALSFIIMLFALNIPFFPFFLEIDFSEVPAMILAYVFGPLVGISVVFAKNFIHLFISSNMGIGELANSLVGASLVGVSSYLYRNKDFSFLKSSGIAVVVMGIVSVLVNLIIIIPLYEKFLSLPVEKIVDITAAVNPFVNSLFSYLTLSILPFNLLKASIVSVITFLIFNRLKNVRDLKIMEG